MVQRVSEVQPGDMRLDRFSDYLAVFNLGEARATFQASWKELGVAGQVAARDLWSRKDLGVQPKVSIELAPHASVLYRISGKP